MPGASLRMAGHSSLPSVQFGSPGRASHSASGIGYRTLRMWSGTPVAMALLPLSAASSDDPPLPALRLDETPDDKPCRVLPPRTFNPSRVLRSLDAGPDRRFRLTRLLHRGVDFERAAFEETTG